MARRKQAAGGVPTFSARRGHDRETRLLAESVRVRLYPLGMSQLVLQPRGTARDNGPKNFERSIRAGIPVADVAAAAGSDASSLAALYPRGAARLWGSTPTDQKNNPKARALRERRVGDEVLFYASSSFFAHARIVGLFRNPTLAQAVWGTDSQGQTWEHIMALDDVVELASPVVAEPILRAHGVPVPLRSLTLVDTTAAAALTHAKAGSTSAQTSTPVALPRSPLSLAMLLADFADLSLHRLDGVPSRHQPLALLWALGRLAAGEERLAPWHDFRPGVAPLLERYGLPGSRVSPEHPFWHLRSTRFWEVSGLARQPTRTPRLSLLATEDPVAGFNAAAARLLNSVPARVRAVGVLLDRHLDSVDREALLADVGLTGYDSASGDTGEPAIVRGDDGQPQRRSTTTARIIRDRRVANSVKELYGNECQVCGDRLETRIGSYSEAAHVRGLGTPHNGDDVLGNVLCLCPRDHVLFDTLTIYIDAKGIVRYAKDGSEIARLNLHPMHELDMANTAYHRELCCVSE